MTPLLRRSFVVEAPPTIAWVHLARVTEWPRWARHIRSVELMPAGVLTPESQGLFRLRNGVTSRFRMTAFQYPRHWTWVGPFLWLTIHYDHRFEPVDDGRARLTWTLDGEGFGVGLFGRLFAALYHRNLDVAIPRLMAEITALPR